MGGLRVRKGTEGTIYYHQDGLGSILAITDETGAILNKYTYNAFGEPTTIQETVENSILFTGEPYDASGLYYLRARYYDSAIGRFITPDTLFGEMDNPLTQNLYVYCGNNPVLYVDPSGHLRCNQIDNLVGGMVLSLGDTFSALIRSPLELWELIQAIRKDEISLQALAYSMGEAALEPIKHLIDNREVLTSRTVTDDQVTEYGRNLGFLLQEVVGGAGTAKAGVKAIDKLSDASRKGKKIIKSVESSINTPYGKAIQSNSKEALQLRQTVDNGGQLYRTGAFGKSKVMDAQFWAPENPLSSGYANKYGLANSQIDYVIGGTKVSGVPYVTRPAPPVPPNLGGGIEIVTNPNSVRLNFFHMP